MLSIFVTDSIGNGIENIIDQNVELRVVNVLFFPQIYMPIAYFFILLTIGFVIKKLYFKE